MKRMKILILCCFLMVPLTANATESVTEEQQEEIQEDLFGQFDFSEIDEMLSKIFQNEKMKFGQTVLSLITGEKEFSFEMVKTLVKDQFTYELSNSKASMVHILVLVIIAAILSNFSSVFKSTQVSEISFSMLYMLLITICMNNFRILVDSAVTNVGQLTQFMKLLGPIYFLAVAFATGSATSITFYQFVLILIFMIEVIIESFLIPLAQIYLIVRVLGQLSPEIHLTKFAELLETIVSWVLKTLLGAVISLNVIQGLISPAIDSVKRSLLTRGGEAIPIIGDAIGGVAEVVIGTAVLIKNGIGVVGMVVCLAVCISPILQMAITTLMYQVVAALIQPISDKRMVDCVSGMADASKMLLRIVFTTGVLFLITIAVVATTTTGG